MTKPVVTEEMVNRFLSWRLPASFNPDCGISFKRTYNERSPFGLSTHEPTGTNLLDAVQARAMLEHVLATPAPGAPAGFKLVPIEPTPEMISAGQEAQNRACYQKPQPVGAEWGAVYYRAMLDAAPGAPGQEAAAVQSVGAGIIGWATHHEEPMLFPTRKEAAEYCNDDEEPIPLVSALPPSGAGEKTS